MKKEHDFYQISLKVLLKNKRGEILALKGQNVGTQAGFYDFPGGRIDTEEFRTYFDKIIAREVLEEIGDVKFNLQSRPVALGRHLVPTAFSKIGKDIHVLWIFFEADYLGGEVTISHEHTGYKWLDLNKIELTKYFISGSLEGARMYINKKS